MADPHSLQRFVDAQDGVYETVCDELHDGHKRSHWMWFVFPQLRGLGHSERATYFGLASLEEARAYLVHPVLGARLRECTQLVMRVEHRTLAAIFGSPDDRKFHSCMTLFHRAAPDEPAFAQALQQYFGGVPDAATLALLAALRSNGA